MSRNRLTCPHPGLFRVVALVTCMILPLTLVAFLVGKEIPVIGWAVAFALHSKVLDLCTKTRCETGLTSVVLSAIRHFRGTNISHDV